MSNLITMKFQNGQLISEPNLETAKLWWPEMLNKWTSIGWKDTITEFNVLHNGTILNAFYWPEKTREPLTDPQSMYTFTPGLATPDFKAPVPEASAYYDKGWYIRNFPAVEAGTNPYFDDGWVVQGWNDCEAPVLHSDWTWQGFIMRQEVFAHIPGGKAVVTGDEPHFMWVRLSVNYASEGVPLPDRAGFGIQINSMCIGHSMKKSCTLSYSPDFDRKYPGTLTTESEIYDKEHGFYLLEDDNRVRLAVAPGSDCLVAFKNGHPTEKDSLLYIEMPGKQGAYVDLLLPMLPTERGIFDKELALGLDAALDEAERFWKTKPITTAGVNVPEDYFNQLLKHTLQNIEVIGEKDPETGNYYLFTGGWGYGIAMWGTCIAIALAELSDIMGRHDTVEKYLKVLKDNQGNNMPPGRCFEKHPGYLGVPPKVNIVDWLPDHGSILWLISQHALLTNDAKFIEEYTPVVVKACEWIQYARRIKKYEGVKGIMPPAGSSDDESYIQNCWTDGWIYKGLSTAVRFLKRINHPRAAEFESEATDYKAVFQEAFLKKTASMHTWTDSNGIKRHLPPLAMANDMDWQYRHLGYLDAGPMQLVFTGLMDAEHESMKSAVSFFREGPPSKLYRFDQDYYQSPCLHHEVSSWEVCYSWNIFHSWQLGDRQRFLEGLYSMMVAGYSQQTFTACEERSGMSALIPAYPTVYLARLAVIDDAIKHNELHLLRLIPLAWLEPNKTAKFEKMPTEYGPVTLKIKLTNDGKTLNVDFSSKFHAKPYKIVLHIPPVEGLTQVIVNGRAVKWNGKSKTIDMKPYMTW